MYSGKALYLLHPEHHGYAIAERKAGVHYKTPKSKMEGRDCTNVGVQWVSVQRVLVPNIVPMYASRQTHIRIMEDVPGDFVKDAWVVWNTDYLLAME